LGKTPGRRSIGGTLTATVCGLGLLGIGALTAHAQVSLPQVPGVTAPAAPAPRLQLPPAPQVSVPEPVQRVLPAPGGSSGGPVSGAVDAVQGVVGGDGSGSGVVDSVGDTVDRVGGGVQGGVERVLGGSGSGGGVQGGVDRVVGGVQGGVERVLGGSGSGGGVRGGVERVLGGGSDGAVRGDGERALGSGSGGGLPGGGAGGASGAAGAGAGPDGAFAAGARGRPGERGRRAGRPFLGRRRAAHRRAIERRRERIVRQLRGCLDVLPPMQRTTLILRYGVGPLRARSGKEAARLLDVSRRRVRVLERRGVRRLASYGEGASCAGTGVEQSTLTSVYDLLSDTSTAGGTGLPAPLQAGVLLASAATAALEEGEGAVAGERESGDEEEGISPDPEEDGVVSSLGNPFGLADPALDNPFLLVLLAIVVACLVSAGRELRRALR
jgi:Sigma-70, region 4